MGDALRDRFCPSQGVVLEWHQWPRAGSDIVHTWTKQTQMNARAWNSLENHTGLRNILGARLFKTRSRNGSRMHALPNRLGQTLARS